MNLSNTLFSKMNAKIEASSKKMAKNFILFHDLIICSKMYEGIDSSKSVEIQKWQNQSERFVNPRTSFYICKRIMPNIEFDRFPTYIIKRLAYRKQNKIDQWGRILYNDNECKNIDQVSTQFHCYQLLKDSHRAVQLVQFIHENTKNKEDKRLFYQFFKLQDRKSLGIKNILFVLEQMNEGSLKQQIDRISNKRQSEFTQEQIIQYSCQIAQGLLELRERGIIHRDLRPQNILFHNKQIKFSDFDSAFIKGYSDYKNIKNGVNMKDTTPLQIMLLISQSEEKLKSYTSEKLYHLQEKADVYFLGVNIYSMIYSNIFESFNGGKVLNNLINLKKKNGFNAKLLDLMASCLQKDPHVRISLDDAISILMEIEKETYMQSSSYNKIYLASEPLNLNSFSSNQTITKLQQDQRTISSDKAVDTYKMNKLFQQKIKIGTIERQTQRYEQFIKDSLAERQNGNIWHENTNQIKLKNEQKNLQKLIQKYLQRLQIKAYYYEFAYRILCEVNLDQLYQSHQYYSQNIQSHLNLLSNHFVVVLTFLYDMIMKSSFTQDPSYQNQNIGYENKRVFDNIRVLYSRRSFFAGRKKTTVDLLDSDNLQAKIKEFKDKNKQQYNQLEEGIMFVLKSFDKIKLVEQIIKNFLSFSYQNTQKRKIFSYQYSNLMSAIQKIQKILKDEMIQTIINLIIAYQKIKISRVSDNSNLKNAVFMLMLLEAQDTNKIHKNDLVIIKTELTNMIDLRLGWTSEQLQAFFNNYTEVHKKFVMQGLQELQSQAMLVANSSISNLGEVQNQNQFQCSPQSNNIRNERENDPKEIIAEGQIAAVQQQSKQHSASSEEAQLPQIKIIDAQPRQTVQFKIEEQTFERQANKQGNIVITDLKSDTIIENTSR